MIYKDGRLVTSISQALVKSGKITKQAIGKVYLGTKLVWVTIYDAIRSCYGSGRWISDRNWLNDDYWKNN